MRRKVEAERAKPRATARAVTLITLGVVAVGALNGTYLAPYGTPLGSAGPRRDHRSGFVGALAWMRALTLSSPNLDSSPAQTTRTRARACTAVRGCAGVRDDQRAGRPRRCLRRGGRRRDRAFACGRRHPDLSAALRRLDATAAPAPSDVDTAGDAGRSPIVRRSRAVPLVDALGLRRYGADLDLVGETPETLAVRKIGYGLLGLAVPARAGRS